MISLEDKIATTVHAILHILKQLGGTGDFHKIFKILYFADQKHLTRFGSLITEDKYIAMNNGPVPSMAYDMLKALRGEGLLVKQKADFEPYFELKTNYIITAKCEADLDELSQAALMCIDEIIEENKNLGFPALTEKSHDAAWKNANQDCEMIIQEIAKAGGADDEMLKYIYENIENQNAVFI